jgi:hypothetical protein
MLRFASPRQTFTDGCGLISYALAKLLADQLKLCFVPSVWQVRYFGHGSICKGVLVTDHASVTDHILTFRSSLRKLQTQPRADAIMQQKLGIVRYSGTAKPASLNSQICRLLSAQ